MNTGRDATDAAVLFETGEPLRLTSLTIPELQPGQVLVDIAYSGVCQSQLLEVRGARGADPYLPHTLGHEGSGTVVETGPAVAKVKVGDRVVLSWIKGIGADVGSSAYASALGPVNSGAVSTFMRRAVVSENRVTPIPEAMPLKEAALLGCAVLTGAGIVLNAAAVTAGASIAIFGIGGIGASAVLGAVLAGAAPIIAVDVLLHKLDLAQRLGATHVINGNVGDVRAAILAATHGGGVDFAVEAAGRRATMEVAFQCVRDGGGLLVIAGNLPHGGRISLDPFDLIRGKRIIGTWGGESKPDRDIPRFIDLYLSGKLPLAPLITATYGLADVDRALADLEDGRVLRALLDMEARA